MWSTIYEVLLQRCVSCMVKLVVSMWWNWRWVTEDYNITDTHAGVAAIANDFRTVFKIYGFKDCMLHFNYCQGCLTRYKIRDFLLNISSIYLLVQVCCLGFVLHNTSVCLRLWQTNKQTNKQTSIQTERGMLEIYCRWEMRDSLLWWIEQTGWVEGQGGLKKQQLGNSKLP